MASRPASAELGEVTAAALTALPPSWAVVSGPVWPEDQFPAVDHIVIGPPGIFVIDSRSWPGRVAVEHGRLIQAGQERSDVVRSVAEAAVSVSGLAASVRFDYVHGVICLAHRDVAIGWIDGVLVCSASELVAELTSYVEVIPGGVGRVVAADIERRLKAGRPRTRDRRPKTVKQSSRVRPAAGAPRRRTPTVAGVAGALAVFAVLLAVSPSSVSTVPGQIAELVEQVTNDDDNPLGPTAPNRPGDNKKKKQGQQERRGG